MDIVDLRKLRGRFSRSELASSLYRCEISSQLRILIKYIVYGLNLTCCVTRKIGPSSVERQRCIVDVQISSKHEAYLGET